MCNKTVKDDRWLLEFVSDNLKKQKMNPVKKNQHRLSKTRRAQKSKIKEELMPIAWHPSRHSDWYNRR